MRLLKPKSQSLAEAKKNIEKVGLSSTSFNNYKSNEVRLPFLLGVDGRPVSDVHNFLHEKMFYLGGYKSVNSIRTYSESLKHWFVYLASEDLDWKNVSVRNIVGYRNHMKSSGGASKKSLSAATVNLRINVVVEFYRYWWSEQFRSHGSIQAKNNLEKSRSRTVRLRVNADRKGARALSLESCAGIYSQLKGVHRLVFLWCVCTGMRIGSVLSLELGQFNDLAEAGIHGFIDVEVKGGRNQSVYVPKVVIEETNNYILIERCLTPPINNEAEERLFLNAKGNYVTRGCYYSAFKRGCAAANIKSHPHQTRATFATHLEHRLQPLKDTHHLDPLKIIQGLLGHASSETTQMYLENIKGRHINVTGLIEDHANAFRGCDG
ncbi:tyrosine-type recombinase/integrase [Pseudomonas putida]|uniref:tyrosine-type recombinase/integrase n=1 Tax=Pseudomonas putida TaxID=303 RepID=UPI002B253923|nr:tyrosine-type recombinase/integrase [Pseudomonas putida]